MGVQNSTYRPEMNRYGSSAVTTFVDCAFRASGIRSGDPEMNHRLELSAEQQEAEEDSRSLAGIAGARGGQDRKSRRNSTSRAGQLRVHTEYSIRGLKPRAIA
jgi:hypothetical protein